jgi:hypothetical protein
MSVHRVSVIMGVYNSGRYLHEVVEIELGLLEVSRKHGAQ